MTIRVAINGFGRIGRNVLRALYEGGYRQQIQVVAINDLGEAALNAHLLKYDSTHGPFAGDVSHDEEAIIVHGDRIHGDRIHGDRIHGDRIHGDRIHGDRIHGDRIHISAIRNPAELPWRALKVDVVYECTGRFTRRDQAQAHLDAGAKKVIVSAPGTDMDATVVYGVNHDTLRQTHQIISNASCTTNCLAPLAQVLHRELGIEQGLMTTIHAYTNDQNLADVYHSDPYRARSATQSMIPTKTGAAAAVGLVLPELNGRLDGMAVRVPVLNVSLVDLTFHASRETSVAEVNALVQAAAETSPVLAYNSDPLVSIDFNHNPASATFDATQTKVNGHLVKVMAWYDNEWGFSHRMLDNTLALINAPA